MLSALRILRSKRIYQFLSMYFHQFKSQSIQSHFVDVNGSRIHCEIVGHGDHAVLFTPGAMGCSKTDYQLQLQNLSPEKFTIIAWDPPGYGKSIPPTRQWPLNFYKEDATWAVGLLKALGITKVSCAGWSDGGTTSLLITLLNPDLVHKLALWGASAYITKTDTEMYKAVRDTSKWSRRMLDLFVQVYGEQYFQEQWPKCVDAYERIYLESGGIIYEGNVSEIKCPTLVLHGDKDPLCAMEHPEYLVTNIPNCKLIRFPEGKHNIHIKYHEEFNKKLEDFLSS